MKISKIDTDLDLKSIELYILFFFFRKCIKNSTCYRDLDETIFQIELFMSAFRLTHFETLSMWGFHTGLNHLNSK